ncbi:MAG TPA: hypothetical protein VN687_11950 [Blastocatellia bacterium]|nr:hypothetical protein [Blastocatellia bacterium]
MRVRKILLIPISCLLIAAMSTLAMPQAGASCYPNVPDALDDRVTAAADAILRAGDTRPIGQFIPDLISFAIADALGGSASQNLRSIQRMQYDGEVMRTDTQIGATSSSSGATSAFEKPGLSQLLGFAIEHGAIQQQLSDTTVTLSTSPYAFIALAKGDTPKTYQDAELFNRIGVAATFLLSDPKNVIANVSRKQLTEWSARARLSGDRSTRSKAFHDYWDKTVGALIQSKLDVFGPMATKLLSVPAVTDTLPGGRADAVTPLITSINAYIQSHQSDVTSRSSAARSAIKDLILCALRTSFYEPVQRGAIKVDDVSLAASLAQLGELQQKIAAARVQLKQFLKDFAKSGTLSTFEYTNHRVPATSDYSEFKLLFERHVKPMDVVANAGFSIYNNPDKTRNQDKLRDYLVSFSVVGTAANPLFRGDPDLATPITYSFTGRFQRLMENENMTDRQPDIGSFQAQLEIPVTPGLSIPIAYTYSSATETMAKKENRFNIGLHLDINKVINSRRANSGQ